jgi:Spy/CpxP family protein refolding chaperone
MGRLSTFQRILLTAIVTLLVAVTASTFVTSPARMLAPRAPVEQVPSNPDSDNDSATTGESHSPSTLTPR